MKKLAAICTMAVVVSLCSTTVLAHGHGGGHGGGWHGGEHGWYGDSSTVTGQMGGCGLNHIHVDYDGDGICDNWGSGTCGLCNNFVDENGDGICDNYHGTGVCGQGTHHRDFNGDGICDNRQYAIRYNLNGGKNSRANPTVYCKSTKTVRLKNASRQGYVFKGWYTNKKCTKKATSIKQGSSGAKVFYAKWKKAAV